MEAYDRLCAEWTNLLEEELLETEDVELMVDADFDVHEAFDLFGQILGVRLLLFEFTYVQAGVELGVCWIFKFLLVLDKFTNVHQRFFSRGVFIWDLLQ